MERIRIIIAFSSDSQSINMRNLLAENGYDVIDMARDGQECLRKARVLEPDAVILDFDLPVYTGYHVAKVLIEDNICNVILIAKDNQKSLINEYKDHWGFTCLVKPINRSALISTIELMMKNNKRIKMLEKEIKELKQSLENRKEIEKAKGILMKQLGIAEEEAFRKIQKQSMDKGVPMKEIAKAIILAYDM